MHLNHLTTESQSLYQNLENESFENILNWMNQEDKKVALAIEKCIPQIEKMVSHILPKMQMGGRLFYIGSGTSGRLGVVDASELPPTFGVDFEKVIGIIAGGDTAIRKAVEGAEDDQEQGWNDLKAWQINSNDVLIGIAASGRTPYVIGAMKKCMENGITTACITCNEKAEMLDFANFPIVAEVGPEFITGSTRLKAGTAQKLILNMISTSLMIKLGHVKGNKMVDMQLSNKKLVERGAKMIVDEIQIPLDEARTLLLAHGSVRKAIEAYKK
jgi:N-acetylmuramic acid 6-phosphate etherase